MMYDHSAVKRVIFSFFLVFIYGNLRIDSFMLKCGLSPRWTCGWSNNWRKLKERILPATCEIFSKFTLHRIKSNLGFFKLLNQQQQQQKQQWKHISIKLLPHSDRKVTCQILWVNFCCAYIVQNNWMNTKCEWQNKVVDGVPTK